MATKKQEDIDVPDFLHCSVCLEYFHNRSPRILNCHHSFCQSCLICLLRDGAISCPTCRTTTEVEDDNINNLPINFLLLQVLERETQLASRDRDLSKCYFCNERPPVHKCETCARVICKECSVKHETSQLFHDHDLRSFCEPHAEGISHICFNCMKEICVKCAMFNHGDHETDIIPYKEGIARLQNMLESLIKDIEKVKAMEAANKSVDLKKINAANIYKKKVAKDKENAEKHSKSLEKMLDSLNEDEKIGNALIRMYDTKVDSLDQLIQHCKELLQEKTDLAANLNILKQKFQDVKEEKLKRYTIPDFIPTEELKDLIGPLDSEPIWLDEPILIQHLIKCPTLQLYVPIKASPVDEDHIVFADYHLNYISMVNREGELKAKFPTTTAFGRVLGLSICEKYLFVAQENGITKVTLDFTNPRIVGQFQPQVNFIRRLLAVSQSEIYCSDSDVGIVYKYNPLQDDTKIVLKNINGPSYINFSETIKGPRFFVTVEQSHQINIYTREWELLLTVGGYGTDVGCLRSPREVIVLPDFFLVADDENHRVCMFDQEGVFVRNILTGDQCGANPCGMVYQPPYLWVTRRYSQGIMCFKVLQ